MGDAWLVRIDEADGPRYLYELGPSVTVLVPWPEDAATFSHAGARQAIRKMPGSRAEPVRRFEELRR